VQAHLNGDDAAAGLAQGTPVNVHLPPQALRVLPETSVSP
jgi:hypothetical protein